MELTRIGLLLDLLGAILLALQIIGKERVDILEKWLRSLPGAPGEFVFYIIGRVINYQANKVQNGETQLKQWEKEINQLKYLLIRKEKEVYRPKNIHQMQINFHDALPSMYFIARIGVITAILLIPVYLAIISIVSIPIGFIKIGFFLRDRLKIESVFALLGILFLILGFLSQLIGSYHRR